MANIRKSRQPNSPPDGEPWVWVTANLLASYAWRAMTVNAKRVLERILLEHMAHAGKENGRLQVTHRQFIEAGVSRDYVGDAIDELAHLRLVKITTRGRGGAGTGHSSRFLLTWFPEKGSRYCDDPWKMVDAVHVQKWNALRKVAKKARKRSVPKRSGPVTKNHFPTPQMRARSLRKCGVDQHQTSRKNVSNGHIPTPGMRSTINILPGSDVATDETLNHISKLMPDGWCQPKAQARSGMDNKVIPLPVQNQSEQDTEKQAVSIGGVNQ